MNHVTQLLRFTYQVEFATLLIAAASLGALVFFRRWRAASFVGLAGFALPYVVVAIVFDSVSAMRMVRQIGSNFTPLLDWAECGGLAILMGAALRVFRQRVIRRAAGHS